MADICGDAAILFEGEDPADIADKILEVVLDPSLRKTLSSRAVQRSTQFSWQEGAEKVYQVFQQLAPESLASSREAEAIPPERRT